MSRSVRDPATWRGVNTQTPPVPHDDDQHDTWTDGETIYCADCDYREES